jgi:hypothetical protein
VSGRVERESQTGFRPGEVNSETRRNSACKGRLILSDHTSGRVGSSQPASLSRKSPRAQGGQRTFRSSVVDEIATRIPGRCLHHSANLGAAQF